MIDGNECVDADGNPVCLNNGDCEDIDFGFVCTCDRDAGITGDICQCE